MSGTTRIPAAEITGFKGWLIKRFARRTLGTVPTSIGVYWHHQQVLMDMASVGRKVQKWDRCDEQLKSFAHMVVASRVGCSWCLDFNYFEAHNKDLDMDKAREVPRWRESEVFSPLERAGARVRRGDDRDPADRDRRHRRVAACRSSARPGCSS